ncbi:MAG: bifunctional phosphopantothenoylcysteine decarboxylase/phosphopantothenate--cysteine ligase CoaBC [Polyangiaceae bacterium]|nr:bifunctional phosphopantothenoylcysteine decarboxylase/phosphopantothenate--cysteine ligase CoaBC [Polyangiaceae bacterium]
MPGDASRPYPTPPRREPSRPHHSTVGAPPKRVAGPLSGQQVALGVTGSIAAYKAALIARLLVKQGATVQVLMTRAALEFVGPATFTGITGRPPIVDMFDPGARGESHVEIARTSHLIIVAPATADTLARLAAGRADDPVAAVVLAAACPILLAPAMHPSMWANPATRRNAITLKTDGNIEFVGPEHGEVASGDWGVGRMADPEDIVAHAARHLVRGDLAGRHVVVTAGPTVEDLDPVRYLSNRSSGKMGFAVAERAAARGARVTLITGPVPLKTPPGVLRVDVRSAIAMRSALWQALGPDLANADMLAMVAAVADYRPAEVHSSKIKRHHQGLTVELQPNPDILAEVGQARRAQRPLLIGFALETDADERVLANARQKLEEKRVDLVVANHAGDALERDENRASLVTDTHQEPLARTTKVALAERILDWVAQCFIGDR